MRLFSFALTKNPISIFVVIILTVCIWIIAGWNYYNSDYENYRIYYDVKLFDRLAFGELDFGYHYFSYIFYILGFDFESFRIAVYGLCLFFISYYCLRWSKVPVFCLLFYIAFHFLRDVVQTRNFIASIFILFAIQCLLYDEYKYKILLFVLVMVAYSIHMSFVLYLIFCLPNMLRKISYFKFLFVCVCCSFIASTLMSHFSSFLNIGLLSEKVANYLSYAPVWSVVLSSLLAIVNGIVLKYYLYRLKMTPVGNSYIRNVSLSRFMDVVVIVNIASCIFVLFSSVNFSFYGRLFGNILLVNIICISNIVYFLKQKRVFVDYLILGVYVAIFVYFLRIEPFDMHYHDVVSNNYIL